MAFAAFDTYAAAKALREAGFDERQAEAAVVMVRDAMTEGVASRNDIGRLENRLENDIARIEDRLDNMEKRMRDMASKADLTALETRLTNRFYAAVGIGVGVMVAAMKLL